MTDLVALFVMQARDAWALVLLLLTEYAASARALRLDGLRANATPPWWKDRAYLRALRAQGVSRLWVLVGLLSSLIWTNHAAFDGAARVVALSTGSVLVLRLWKSLARGDSLARALSASLDRVVRERVEVGVVVAPAPAPDDDAPLPLPLPPSSHA